MTTKNLYINIGLSMRNALITNALYYPLFQNRYKKLTFLLRDNSGYSYLLTPAAKASAISGGHFLSMDMISDIETTDIKASFTVSRLLWSMLNTAFAGDDDEDALSFRDKELLDAENIS